MSDDDIKKLGDEQMSYLKDIDVVLMSNCKNHFFHAECLTHQLGDKPFIKCSICSTKYGDEVGNMPNGTMTITRQNGRLPGHEKDSEGMWVIHYSISGGSNEKGSFGGDAR